MYLTKLTLDLGNVFARQCMTDCQNMHRSIMRLFGCKRNDGGVLYRFYPEKFSVYIFSRLEPCSDNIAKGMNFAGTKRLDNLKNVLLSTEKFAFDIVTSPCKKVSVEGIKNSKRRFLETPEERRAWLERKAEQNGFRVIRVEEELLQPIYGKHDDLHGGKFYCTSVRFSGVLEVKDKNLFYNAYCNGIGSGKAYGQGMLLLRRLVNC